MPEECPECHSPISQYKSADWREWICWNCGHYESNSPAYRSYPELFENMVRNDPTKFMKEYLKIVPPNESKQTNKPEEEATEPKSGVTRLQVTNFHMNPRKVEVTKTSQNPMQFSDISAC